MEEEKRVHRDSFGAGGVLLIVAVVAVMVFGSVLGISGRITGAAVAGQTSDLNITNLELQRNDHTINTTFENSTFMEWILKKGGHFTDFVEVNASLGIGGVIGIVNVVSGSPTFYNETEGIPFFTSHKEFKLTAINKANPALAEKLAPPNFATVNGHVVPTSLEYQLNTSLLPFFPGEAYLIGNVASELGYYQGLPTYQNLYFEFDLKKGDEIYYYFLACNHVCRITRLKHIKILPRQPRPTGGGGGSATRNLPCLFSTSKVTEGPCINGQKQVTYKVYGNRPPPYCPVIEEIKIEPCNVSQQTWPPGGEFVKGKPAQPLPPEPEPEELAPVYEEPIEIEPVQDIEFAPEHFEESYLSKDNCMSIPTFFGNVRACWD